MILLHGCVVRMHSGEMIIRMVDGRRIPVPSQKNISLGDPVKVAWDHHNNSVSKVYTMEEAREETSYTPDEGVFVERETVEENFPFLEHEEL